ncbi:MAG: DUF2589 domain-containing protein [Thermoflexibacter sp.]|jgi:hypothetical protein|nr:DUF2589 domain-containing protein [Thermoflexibacter sp.]
MPNESLTQKMESLIAKPLLAVAKANGEMAMAQVQFMFDTCFTNTSKEGEEPLYAPVMVAMELTQSVIIPGSPAIEKTDDHEAVAATEASIKPVVTSFHLPLLTIVPLNSLAIDTVNINLDLTNEFAVAEEPTSAAPTDESMYLKQCTLDVHAGQLPLPKGVNIIIEAFSHSIQPTILPNA